MPRLKVTTDVPKRAEAKTGTTVDRASWSENDAAWDNYRAAGAQDATFDEIIYDSEEVRFCPYDRTAVYVLDFEIEPGHYDDLECSTCGFRGDLNVFNLN